MVRTHLTLIASTLLLCACPSESDPNAAEQGGGAGDSAAPVDGFSLGLTESSTQEMFQVRIEDAMPSPPQKYENDWIITVLDMDGEPMADAELFFVEPFMPAHGHDGSFEPDIVPMDEPGRYSVERINLWMGGDWEVRFSVRTPDGEDKAVFDVFIED